MRLLSLQTKPGRDIVITVCVAVVVFAAGGLLIGLWSSKEMNAVVVDQFNAQQMVIAQTVKARIEREITAVRSEIVSLGEIISGRAFQPGEQKEIIQQALARILEYGVGKIEIADLKTRQAVSYTLHENWIESRIPENSFCDSISFPPDDDHPLWVSQVQPSSSGVSLIFAVPVSEDASRMLTFYLNMSFMLPGLLKHVRSGKTGYAWIISQDGMFLFHPNTDFIGRDAFSVRQEKYPDVSYERINFIQKEKMLKGEQGTGWFYSAWHHGITGRIKKFIAYCPITISEKPRQLWSVAVVAPESEVKDALQRWSYQLFLLQGVVILAVVFGACFIIWREARWSKTLELRVLTKTEALAKSEARYRSLVESAEDFIFTVDREGRFQSMNTFTANFLGGHPEEFIDKHLSVAFPEDDVQKHARIIESVYSSGKSIRGESEVTLAGQSVWISANLMPVKTGSGEVGSVLCIARDITATKNLQRQLVNAEKLASLGTLAAGVAHEINNPLGVILGFCELLLRKAKKGTQQYDDLKTIERQGLHCKETVENLLSFARGEKRKGEYSDLNACIDEIVKIVRHLLEKNGIELVLHLKEDLPLVRSDARHLQQVFLNLITNAMSAMNNGGTLTIHSFLERNSRQAVVQFEDTGTGIPEEHMDRIFEPFFTTKPEGQGTGLGLFVSYGIITSCGGTIECKSTPATVAGKASGTTFIVKLPTAAKGESCLQGS